MAEEELLSSKQLKIIMEALNELGSRHPDLYYESTESVSHLIYDYFKTELNAHKRDLVKDLSAEDIYIKLSLKSKR